MALAAAGSVQAQDDVKIGFITKFPVPFFTSMEDAAKAYAAANPGSRSSSVRARRPLISRGRSPSSSRW
jgi:ABC-type sugar transport system substrate-binding protein